jgi:uncharacterized protein YndB with AHSA1/START domain
MLRAGKITTNNRMKKITVTAVVNASIEKVWSAWTTPEDIMSWCHASDDWHAPYATNNIRVGGTFLTTMAAKDGSVSFDFSGVYTEVEEFKKISYTMEDGRNVEILFEKSNEGVIVTEIFDPENENTEETQQAGWQSILDNFKHHVEKQ